MNTQGQVLCYSSTFEANRSGAVWACAFLWEQWTVMFVCMWHWKQSRRIMGNRTFENSESDVSWPLLAMMTLRYRCPKQNRCRRYVFRLRLELCSLPATGWQTICRVRSKEQVQAEVLNAGRECVLLPLLSDACLRSGGRAEITLLLSNVTW